MKDGVRRGLRAAAAAAAFGCAWWMFSEAGAIGFAGTAWGAVFGVIAAGLFVGRGAVWALWSLTVFSAWSTVVFGAPAASAAARSAATAFLRLHPPPVAWWIWTGSAVCVALVAWFVAGAAGSAVRRVAGALGIGETSLVFSPAAGAAALVLTGALENGDRSLPARLGAIVAPFVVIGAVAMLESIWERLARKVATSGVDPAEAAGRPLAAPRVSRELSTLVMGNGQRDASIEEYVSDDAYPPGGSTTAPPVDPALLRAAARKMGGAEIEQKAAPAPLDAPAETPRAAAEVRSAAADAPLQSLDDYGDEEEQADWGDGFSAATLAAMSAEERAVYLHYSRKAEAEREALDAQVREHEAISGEDSDEPEKTAAAADEPGQNGIPNVVWQMVDLWGTVGQPGGISAEELVDALRKQPDDIVASLPGVEPRMQSLVDGLRAGLATEHLCGIVCGAHGLSTVGGREPAAGSPPVASGADAPATQPVATAVAGPEPIMTVAATAEEPASDAAAVAMESAPEADRAATFEALARDYAAIVEMPTIDAAGYEAATQGLLMGDQDKVMRFGADDTLARVLAGFSGDRESFDMVRTAVLGLSRRMPRDATDPLCAAFVRFLRERLPLGAFGGDENAARRLAQSRFAIAVLDQRLMDLTAFCERIARQGADDGDLAAGAAAEPVYLAITEACPDLRGGEGEDLRAAFVANLSKARHAYADRTRAKADDIEMDRGALNSEENRKRGMARFLRSTMSAEARGLIDAFCELAAAARLTREYVAWTRKGAPLEPSENHRLHAVTMSLRQELIEAYDVLLQRVSDTASLTAMIAGFDGALPAFVEESVAASARESVVSWRHETASRAKALEDALELVARLEQEVDAAGAHLRERVEAAEIAGRRPAVERAADELQAVLERDGAVVKRAPDMGQAASLWFAAGEAGTTAFVLIDGAGAEWKAISNLLVCERRAITVDMAELARRVAGSSGVGPIGSCRIVLFGASALAAPGETCLARLEEIVGSDVESMGRCAALLKGRNTVLTWAA